MTSAWAHLLRGELIVFSSLISLAGCLVAPDGSLQSTVANHPPQIVLESIRPSKTVSEVSNPQNFAGDCPGIRLRAEIFDLDGDPLRVRFVTDNNIDNLAAIISELEYPGAQDVSYKIQDTILPAVSINGIDVQDTHVISMFVTDAAEFKIPETGSANLAEIESDPDGDGVIDHALIEHRWTFQFVDRGDLCPQ